MVKHTPPPEQEPGRTDDGSRRPASSPGWRWILLLVLVALVARSAYWTEIRSFELYETPILDAEFYVEWAEHLSGLQASPHHAEFPQQAPLYPFLLSLVLRVQDRVSIDTIVGLQFLLGTIQAVLIGLLAARIFGVATGRIAGLLAALYVPFFFNEATVMPTALHCLLVVLLLLAAQRLYLAPTARLALLTGIAAGATYLCRAESLVTIVFVGAGLLLATRFRLRRALPLGLVFTAGMAPSFLAFGLYCHSETGVFRVMPMSGGLNLYVGANPEARGTAEPPSSLARNREFIVEDARKMTERELGREVTFDEISTHLKSKVFAFIRERPGDYLYLLLTKLWLFVHGQEVSDILHYRFMDSVSVTKKVLSLLFDFRLLGPLSLLGMALALGQLRGSLVLYLGVLGTAMVILVFAVATRYRLPAAPAFLCFAGFALRDLAAALRSPGRLARKSGLVLGFLLLFIVQNAPATALDIRTGQVWINVGNIRRRAGNLDGALDAYRTAIEVEPASYAALMLQGEIHHERGEIEEARRAYSEVTRRFPSVLNAWMNLGIVHLEAGEHGLAIRCFGEASRLDPQSSEPLHALAVALGKSERWEEAVAPSRAALERSPEDPALLNQLAWTLFNRPGRTREQLEEARDHCERAVDIATARALPELTSYRDTLERVRKALRLD